MCYCSCPLMVLPPPLSSPSDSPPELLVYSQFARECISLLFPPLCPCVFICRPPVWLTRWRPVSIPSRRLLASLPNLIGAIKTFKKPNFNVCTEECLTILKNTTWQTCHGYEQELGDVQGLPVQNDFLSIFPNTGDSIQCVKGLGRATFSNLRFWKCQR